MNGGLHQFVTLPFGIAGLIVPGLLVARALHAPAAWAAALPLSAACICLAITLLQLVGLPITMTVVGAVLAAVSAVALAADRHPRPEVAPLADDPPGSAGRAPMVTAAMIVFVVATAAVFAMRVTLFPLSGADTLWRWEYLARLLLEHRSLDFYPPRSAADYEIYFYPEGIAPLVSGVYWWLYAAAGQPTPMLTGVAVVGQLVSIAGLVHAAAVRLWGTAAGWPAVALLFATPLFISAVAIGQETGYTASAVAGQILCTVAARRQGSVRLAVAAGLFAAVGALARDYGLALIAVGGLVLAEERRAWRLVPAFLIAAAMAAAPWYLRSWALTGNPVFSNPTPLHLPTNAVHEGILTEYRAVLGLARLSWAGWIDLGKNLLVGGGLLLMAGLGGLAVVGRRMPALLSAVFLITLLWAWSVGFTAGGLHYSLRVLSPAWVVLAIAAAAAVARELDASGRPRILAAFVAAGAVAWGAFSIATTASHPLPISRLPRTLLAMRSDPLDTYSDLRALAAALAKSRVESCRVLTDNTFFATVLRRTNSRFRPLLVWSPVVAGLCDEAVSPAAARQQLATLDAPLVCISPGFLNWRYLRQWPFFHADAPSWKLAFQLRGDAIRSMPTVKPLTLRPE